MTTPLFLSDPHKDTPPHSYVVQVSSCKCLNCQATSSSCEVFARTWLKGQWGKPFSNLRPMKNDKPRYNLPIEILHKQTDLVPFCHLCPNPAGVTSSLPYPPVETTKTTHVAGFQAPATAPASSAGAPKKKTTTTDDLMKGLDL